MLPGAMLAALPPMSNKLARLDCLHRLADIVLLFSYSPKLAITYLTSL